MTPQETLQPRRPTLPPIAVHVERWAPALAAAAGAMMAITFGAEVEQFCRARSWQFSEIYNAVSSFAAVIVGGLLAAYALLIVDTTSTLRKVRRTKAFARFLSFMREGLGLSILLACVSVPLVVIKPSFLAADRWEPIAAALWLALTFAVIASVVRVVGTIRLLTEEDDNDD